MPLLILPDKFRTSHYIRNLFKNMFFIHIISVRNIKINDVNRKNVVRDMIT